MKTKYFKRFALTDRLVSIEELRHIAQMQARMDELVRYSPIQHLSDGYSFSMDEVCDTEISFSDILWAEGINAEHSSLHMKNGETIALPFGTHGLEILLSDSKEPRFLKISRDVFLPVSMIKKVSRKVVYLKGCNISFKVISAGKLNRHISCGQHQIGSGGRFPPEFIPLYTNNLQACRFHLEFLFGLSASYLSNTSFPSLLPGQNDFQKYCHNKHNQTMDKIFQQFC